MNRLILPLFFILIFILFTHGFEGSGDFYHHINTGKYVLEQHSLPYLDGFSHTANGLPWIAHSWASGVVFYLIFISVGSLGISLFCAFLALVLFYLLYLLLKSYQIPDKAALATMFLIAAPLATRWPQRPELFSYPFTVSILLIDKLREKKPRLAILIPVLILLWANFYGSGVIFGLGLVGLLIAKQFLSDHFKILPRQRLFYLFTLSAFPLSLLNGYGFKTIFYVYLFIPQVSVYEGEWLSLWGTLTRLPLSLLVTYQYYILIYLLGLVFFLLLVGLSWPVFKKNKFSLLLSLAVFAPILAFRQMPLAFVLAALPLALAVNYQLEKKRAYFLIITMLLGILLNSINIWLSPPQISTGPDPVIDDMTGFIRNNNLSGKAFNQNSIGAYLTYQFYPKILVFFDTRDDLYVNTQALSDLYQTSSSGTSVIPLLNKYKIDLVVANYNQDQINYRDLFYSPDWAVVFLNDRYLIALPAKVAKSKNLATIESVDPYSASGAKPGLENEAINFYRSELIKNPGSPGLSSFLTEALLATKQYDQAIKVISGQDIDLRSPLGPLALQDKYLLLAESYLDKNDCGETTKYLKLAQSLNRPFLMPFIEQTLSTKIDKILGFYQLVCLKDKASAQTNLEKYLSQPDISPLEKVKVYKQFSDESH